MADHYKVANAKPATKPPPANEDGPAEGEKKKPVEEVLYKDQRR